MSERKPVLSVRISQDLMDKLVKLEERTGVGRAEIVERCLAVGVQDQEEYVEWLESSWKGPILSLLMHPKVAKAMMSMTGNELDETQEKVRANVTDRRKAKLVRPKTA
ncbi:MAG TPA: ribbon-helix-helix protein, CopG family [Tepidisphaeraceae bacterium]|nr:ribbon-helix-helix protein, CopG family [Tepidisphaeraceae bacterium]